MEDLKEHLYYNPETGIFNHLKVKAGIKPGDVAGHLHSKGYVHIYYKGRQYKAHRLAWFYVHGSWPKDQLNHKNCKKDDNRLSNLEPVNNRENSQRRVKHLKGKLPGNTFDKKTGKYMAMIYVGGIHRHLGRFNTETEAHDAYLTALGDL